MKFNYDEVNNSLHINFKNVPGIDSYEIAPDCIADIDENGKIIGIKVLNAKDKFDFHSIIFNKIPIEDISFLS